MTFKLYLSILWKIQPVWNAKQMDEMQTNVIKLNRLFDTLHMTIFYFWTDYLKYSRRTQTAYNNNIIQANCHKKACLSTFHVDKYTHIVTELCTCIIEQIFIGNIAFYSFNWNTYFDMFSFNAYQSERH